MIVDKLVRQWVRLNAPREFGWTDEDVLDEKVEGYFNGIITGIIIMFVIWILIYAVL